LLFQRAIQLVLLDYAFAQQKLTERFALEGAIIVFLPHVFSAVVDRPDIQSGDRAG